MGILDAILGWRAPNDLLFIGAAAANNAEVRKALRRGADPNAREPAEGQTPLHVAVRRSWTLQSDKSGLATRARGSLADVAATVDALLEAGAEPGLADNDGITSLHWAAGHGMTNIVRTLIEAGADVNAVDKSSYTPLHQAVSAGHIDTVRMLIDAGADVNVRSCHGETALMFAERNRVATSTGRNPFERITALLHDHGNTG